MLLESAREEAGPNGPVDATFQQLLNTAASEFTTTGDLSAKTKAAVHAGEVGLNADAAMTNLAARFQSIGQMSSVPNLHRVLDRDEGRSRGHQ